MGWGSPECAQRYWPRWGLGLLGGWVVGVETDVVLLGPPIPHLCIIPMHHGQSGRYVRKWTSNVTSCQSGNTVKNCVKFQQSLVKSRSVSNVECSMKPGRVRCELKLCVRSPVTEDYGKAGSVLELSRSYVRDGQR